MEIKIDTSEEMRLRAELEARTDIEIHDRNTESKIDDEREKGKFETHLNIHVKVLLQTSNIIPHY